MKNIFYIFAALIMAVFSACEDKIDFPYQGKDRIQFSHYTTNHNGQRTYSDSLTFSFGLLPDSVRIDTAEIVVEILGEISGSPRKYKILVDTEKTTAVTGTHYEAIDSIQTFHANQNKDTLRIVILRENLSNDFYEQEDMHLYLRLEATEDFDLGLKDGLHKKITMNNYLSEPRWWENNFHGILGPFHPKKWQLLISFDERFSDFYKCPFNDRNEGRQYREALREYLMFNPTYDDKTGARIYINRMEAQE